MVPAHGRALLAGVTLLLLLSGCAQVPADAPASPSASIAESTPAPTPTSTASSEPLAAFEDCYEMATEEWLASADSNQWVGWSMVGEAIGHSPFDKFPGGAPVGQLSCRWGPGPEVATDNVLDLAWAPIDGQSATAAQLALAAMGYERIDSAEGLYLALPTDPTRGWADGEGYGEAYLFTGSDVRWAVLREHLRYIEVLAS